MGPAIDEAVAAESHPVDSPPASDLPHGFALLGVAAVEPAWTSLTLQLDAHGCRDATLRWAASTVEALSILRDESFDCVAVAESSGDSAFGTTATTSLDLFELVRALRTSGHDEPIIVLASRTHDDDWAKSVELECALVTLERGWESKSLLPLIRREMRRAHLKRDNHRLAIADKKRLVRERDETEHLLDRQRQILNELRELVAEADAASDDATVDSAPTSVDVTESESVCRFYDELLRTYVMMGSGRLEAEIEQLTHLLATAGVSLRRALDMHLTQVERLVRGLGNRSSRHVMSRADILALELMIQLGECYRRGVPESSPTVNPIETLSGAA